jgi:hypothetical protein
MLSVMSYATTSGFGGESDDDRRTALRFRSGLSDFPFRRCDVGATAGFVGVQSDGHRRTFLGVVRYAFDGGRMAVGCRRTDGAVGLTVGGVARPSFGCRLGAVRWLRVSAVGWLTSVGRLLAVRWGALQLAAWPTTLLGRRVATVGASLRRGMMAGVLL